MYSTTTTVNVANINRVIEFIEQGQAPFGMWNWSTCIAGQTLHAHNIPVPPRHDLVNLDRAIDYAVSLLGIGAGTQNKLFLAGIHCADPNTLASITREQACTVLRHLAATGEVDWSVIDDRHAEDAPVSQPSDEPHSPQAARSDNNPPTPSAAPAASQRLSGAGMTARPVTRPHVPDTPPPPHARTPSHCRPNPGRSTGSRAVWHR